MLLSNSLPFDGYHITTAHKMNIKHFRALKGIFNEGKCLLQVVGDHFDAAIRSENGLKWTQAKGMIPNMY